MERLTERGEDGKCFVRISGDNDLILGAEERLLPGLEKWTGWWEHTVLGNIVDRLAAYEDTELSPEEIIELKGQNGGAREVKRLTHALKSGSWGIRGNVDDAVLRLAAIEDILGDKYDLDRLRELVQADREGRCVVIRPNLVTDDNYKIICRKINAEDIHLGKMRNVHEKHK